MTRRKSAFENKTFTDCITNSIRKNTIDTLKIAQKKCSKKMNRIFRGITTDGQPLFTTYGKKWDSKQIFVNSMQDALDNLRNNPKRTISVRIAIRDMEKQIRENK